MTDSKYYHVNLKSRPVTSRSGFIYKLTKKNFMATFIELIDEKGEKEIYNTDQIQIVHVYEGKVIVRFSRDNIQGIVSMTVKNTYPEIKKALIP